VEELWLAELFCKFASFGQLSYGFDFELTVVEGVSLQ
jgi:hypothetical protein